VDPNVVLALTAKLRSSSSAVSSSSGCLLLGAWLATTIPSCPKA
jgi:hypothetical protein